MQLPINTNTKLIRGAIESRQGGRAENQDSAGFADTPLGFLLVLCDGMGGGPGGRTASSSVVQSVIQFIASQPPTAKRKQAVKDAIAAADALIVKMTTENPALRGMGTTICVLLINETSAVVGHVGDSRIYQFRRGTQRISRLLGVGPKVFRSADHSMVAEKVRNGELTEEQARLSSNSNIITRAINGRGIAQPDVKILAYERGDRFMLCSDGIWGVMPEPILIEKATMIPSVEGTVIRLASDCDNLGKAEGGHHDNLTVAIVDTLRNSKRKVKMGKTALRTILVLTIALVLSLISTIYFWRQSVDAKLIHQQYAALSSDVEDMTKEIAKLQEGKNSANENVVLKQQIGDLVTQMQDISQGAKAVEKGEATRFNYSRQIKDLERWSTTEKRIAAKNIDEVLNRLHHKECHCADAELNRAKEVLSEKTAESKRVQVQREQFKTAANKIRNFQ